jgi:hypothetical protein
VPWHRFGPKRRQVGALQGGRNVDELLKLLQSVARDGQSMNTGPIIASVGDGNPKSSRFVHTVVPITDASGSTVTRLFIYSEKVV